MDIRGLYPALVTPFDKDFSVNYPVLREVVRFTKEKGSTGFYVGGSTGETFSLSVKERKKILEVVMEEAGDFPVIAHIGVLNPEDLKDLARHAASAGAAAVSSVPPFYYQHTEAEITAYYLDVVEASGLPVLLYNIPKFTGVSLNKKNCAKLFATGKVAGVKHTSYNIYDLERLKAAFPKSVMLAGHDEVFCPAQLMGAEGCIGSMLNIVPGEFAQMDRLLKEGKTTEAMAVQHKVNDFIDDVLEFNYFPAVKHIMTLMGFPVGTVRRPLLDLSDADKKAVEAVYKKHLA